MNDSLNSEDNRFAVSKKFPKLNREGFVVTSPEDNRYNCIAFAAGDDSKCWWPDAMNLYYWHPEVKRENSLEAFCLIFSKLGYLSCESGDLEIGFDRIAIFTDGNGLPTHCARQTQKGAWLSKLGQFFDIEHVSVDGVTGSAYGKVAVFMKRKLEVIEC